MKINQCYSLLCLYLFAFSPSVFAETILLDREETNIRIGDLDVIRDTAKTLEFEQARQAFRTGKAEKLTEEPELDLIHSQYWLEFSLTSAKPHRQEYLLDFGNWARVEVWAFPDSEQRNLSKHAFAGHRVPFRDRDCQLERYSMVKLPIEAGESVSLMVRLEGQLSINNYPERLGFNIHESLPFHNQVRAASNISSITIGIMFLMLFYNIVLFGVTKQKRFRFYLLFLFFQCIFFALDVGAVTHLLQAFEQAPILIGELHSRLIFFIPLTNLLFMNDFLDVAKRYPFWGKFNRIQIYFLSLVIVLGMVFPRISDTLVMVDSPFLIISFLVCSVRSLWDKYPSSLYYFLGFLAFHIGALSSMFITTGALPNNPTTVNLWPLFSCIEVALFSLALGNQINILRKDNFRKQELIILNLRKEAKTRQRISVAVAEAGEKYRNEIASRLHDDLQNNLVALRFKLWNIWKHAPVPPENDQEQILGIVGDTIEYVREMSHEMMPVDQHINIVDAIQEYLRKLSDLDINLDFQSEGNPPLPLGLRALIFRSVKELVTNSLKYSGADQISISLIQSNANISLTVNDNGKGFHYDQEEVAGSGIGNIKLHVGLHGGSFKLRSSELSGTEVCIEIPIPSLETVP